MNTNKMPILDYIKKINLLYGNGADETEDPRYIDPLEMQKIKEAIPVSPLVKKDKEKKWKYTNWLGETEPKKKIIKKEIKVVEKPIKPKPLVPEWDWRLGDWRDLFDEDAPSPPPEDIEKVLNIKKKEVAGLEAILNLHKKRA